MPLLSLHTNYEISKERKPKLLRVLSKLVHEETGKPEAYIMVSIHHPEAMLFATEETPTAFVEFKSIGLEPKQVQKLSASVCTTLEQELSIPAGRVYIQFENAEGAMWGWNKRTF